jgi:hypothetical protein
MLLLPLLLLWHACPFSRSQLVASKIHMQDKIEWEKWGGRGSHRQSERCGYVGLPSLLFLTIANQLFNLHLHKCMTDRDVVDARLANHSFNLAVLVVHAGSKE